MPTVVHVVSAVFDESIQAAAYLSARDDPHVHLEHVMWRLCVPPSPVLSVPATAAVTPPCQFIHSPIHPFMHPCIHSSIHPFIWLPQPSLSMSPGLFLWSPGLFLWLAARAEQHAQSSTRSRIFYSRIGCDNKIMKDFFVL